MLAGGAEWHKYSNAPRRNSGSIRGNSYINRLAMPWRYDDVLKFSKLCECDNDRSQYYEYPYSSGAVDGMGVGVAGSVRPEMESAVVDKSDKSDHLSHHSCQRLSTSTTMGETRKP